MEVPSYLHPMTSHERLPTSEFTHLVARDGVASHRRELAALGARAVAIGVQPGAASVLLDPSSSDIVRERAFAVVARALTGRRLTPDNAGRSPEFVVVA